MTKKIFLLLFILSLFFPAMLSAAGTLGDVNDDGTVNIVDALIIAQHYVGYSPTPFLLDRADVNGDKSVDIVDALMVAQYYVGLIPGFAEIRYAYATHFDSLGTPYGGCGVPESILETEYYVALNVQNTPGDYSTYYSRPMAQSLASFIGEFDNGRNCGRWVEVTIEEFCTGINDGQAGMPFCRGGDWVADYYSGATLQLIVADSCQDGNAWCRDDRDHLDLSTGSLNHFIKDGQPVGDLSAHWGNRKISWKYIKTPNYTGDIRIWFIKDSQQYWTGILITHLENGIHNIEEEINGQWVKAEKNSDMGQSFLLASDKLSYRIRVYDAEDKLLNNGRIYQFDFPASCGGRCTETVTEVSYTTM